MKVSYNWLKWYVPDCPPAEELADIITYHLTEVESVEKKEDDFILDVNVLPNRAHDLLSHQGIAREIASLLDIKYVDPTPKYKVPESKPTKLKISIENNKCRRYMSRIVRGVKVGPSPEWVVKHLESIGQKSINNIVDATNIVMFDCGQPTHIFDFNKMQLSDGNPKIVISTSDNTKEKFLTTLHNNQVNFQGKELLVIDGYYDQPMAIAGVIGGNFAEVDDNTKDIILEVANFDPISVRKTAQALNIFTDARKRFENDLSPERALYGMLELSALIYEMCPDATFEEVVDTYPEKQKKRRLAFKLEKVSKILGITVSVDEVKNILERYNFEYTEKSGEFEIIVPPMRLDLEIEEDMAEEIGRILGYKKVKSELPKINFTPITNQTYSKISWAREKLLNDGYSEVMNTSFSNTGEVEVKNSASDKNFLRTNLSDGLKESIKLNKTSAPFLGLNKVKIFEVGTVFRKKGEEMHVAYGDSKDIKEVGLDEFCKDMPKDFSLEPKTQNRDSKFKMWSLFPFIVRDVAVWVPESVASDEVLELIKDNAGDLVIRGPELFDEFKKVGQISYAFRLIFQSFKRTLTDDEINTIMDKIAKKIKAQKTGGIGWQVR